MAGRFYNIAAYYCLYGQAAFKLYDMLLNFILSVFALSAGPLEVKEVETAVKDTLAESVMVSSFKQSLPVERIASPISSVYLKEIEHRGLKSPKDLSAIIPNLHIPDYGSAMTSTIYLRGFGSRIDNPVIGLYIDDVPVLNKNAYDLEMFDVRRADFLRGPQGTLYGRNSLCGVLSLSTVSPFAFEGCRAGVEYGSADNVAVRASGYHKTENGTGYGLSLNYRHSGGFYTNEYDGKSCDPYDALAARFRVGREFSSGVSVENILYASGLGQGGYAYRLYDVESGVLAPVNYNDKSAYNRLNITEALKVKYEADDYSLSSVTSWQYLKDRMELDQDFTPMSMFTLVQSQRENAVTQEFILKPRSKAWKAPWWDWQTGIYGFFRHNKMSAPVTMKQDGISQLILGNMPEMIRKRFSLREDSFPIESDFLIRTFGTAVYHESYFTVGKWLFTAGLRLDYEGNYMSYDSRATIGYKMVPMIPDFREVTSSMDGKQRNHYVECIPKVSVLYDLGDFGGKGSLRLFAAFSKGYKAGGFNTQIFSDILQNRLMGDIMSDAMGSMGGGQGGGMPMPGASGRGSSSVSEDEADRTSYLPERSFNYELGGNFSFDLPGTAHNISGAASVFYIDCRNQQITVFPDGKSTGRMMANAGRSGSFGAELQLDYRISSFSASVSYGYNRAKFVKYNDGKKDYAGNRIPYSPSNTLNIRAGYKFSFKNDVVRSLSLAADLSGTGRIWWDEANTLSQPFYTLLGADVRLSFKWFDLFARGDNLTDTGYDVFYFKSVGNSFFQTGKPARFNVGVSVEF